MPQYMLLIYADPATAPVARAGAGRDAEVVRLRRGAARRPARCVAGDALQPTSAATTVRERGGERLVTDGPFAETKEQLGGYYLIDVPDLDAALDWASQGPERRARLGRGAAGDEVRLMPAPAPPGPAASAERAFREEGPRVLATLTRHLGGDIALAEDALQDALADALATWDARRRAAQPRRLDHDRRAAAGDRPPAPRAGAGAPRRAARRCWPRSTGPRPSTRRSRETQPEDEPVQDDRLRMLFTCCHPALAMEARVALTLRTLGGLTTRGDRARVPRLRADDGAADRPRQAQDRRRLDPLRGPARRGAPGPARRRARRRLPDLQRGLPGGVGRRPRARRPRRRGAAPRRACSPS